MGKTELKKRCLILGGGEIIDYAAVATQIDRDDFILCADSGFLHCEKLGVVPDLLVGDFDSISAFPPGSERIAYPAEKNYTDSTLAVREAFERGYTELLMAGMLGGRFDHSLANMQNLAWCAGNGINARITDGKTEVFAVKDGELALPSRENSYFSVFPLVTGCESVTITGGKYPLNEYSLRFDEPRAVSNEFIGKKVTVTVKNGTVAVIITPK